MRKSKRKKGGRYKLLLPPPPDIDARMRKRNRTWWVLFVAAVALVVWGMQKGLFGANIARAIIWSAGMFASLHWIFGQFGNNLYSYLVSIVLSLLFGGLALILPYTIDYLIAVCAGR